MESGREGGRQVGRWVVHFIIHHSMEYGRSCSLGDVCWLSGRWPALVGAVLGFSVLCVALRLIIVCTEAISIWCCGRTRLPLIDGARRRMSHGSRRWAKAIGMPVKCRRAKR